jgi:hypothetical protein
MRHDPVPHTVHRPATETQVGRGAGCQVPPGSSAIWPRCRAAR